MNGFGGNMLDRIRMPEDEKYDTIDNSENERNINDLFSDDFDGVEKADLEEKSDVFDDYDIKEVILYDDFVSESQNDVEADNNENNNNEADNIENNNNEADNTENDNNEAENPEYDEDGTRELTDDEKQELKEKLGWSDKKIDDHCRIDENGVIHYKTDCQDKEGTTSDNGVPYERKTIEYKGVKIEGVFPEFESDFDTYLDEKDYQSSSTKQFGECNKRLKESVENDPELRSQFTEEQLEDIENGRTPRGYTWHHSEEPGKMQLVKTEDHDRRIGGAAHTGGNSIWGNKSVDNSNQNNEQKGESF